MIETHNNMYYFSTQTIKLKHFSFFPFFVPPTKRVLMENVHVKRGGKTKEDMVETI